MHRYFKIVASLGKVNDIYYWKSKGLSDEGINSIKTSNYSVIRYLDYSGTQIKVKLNEICLKQDKITYTHGKTVNIYIVYEIS